MKKLMTMVTVVAVMAIAGSALAADDGDVGIFFDAAGTQTSGSITASVPFFLYVVGFNLDGDVFGYELSISNTLAPGLLFILNAIIEPVATATNFGAPDNWIVGTGVCYTQNIDAGTVIGTLNALALAPAVDIQFCLGPSSPTSFNPPAPGYVTCIDPTDLRTFGVATTDPNGNYGDGCAVGNAQSPEPVGNESSSWGSLKANFND